MSITGARVDVTCPSLNDAIPALLGIGFRMDRIAPADHPVEADVSGFGVQLRVCEVDTDRLVPITLRLSAPGADDGAARDTVWPANWTVMVDDADRPMVLPPMVDELVVSRAADAELGVGRAGMRYRDLVPSRHGGRYIASHIHILDGGPVPDYVHFHKIRFQLIFCARGWARLVYEDQGEPFVMHAGDAVLQPPEIRHRVLESSDHLEVVEIGCPAQHDTMAEHGFDLPTPVLAPERDFGGQRFVHHRAAGAAYEPWRHAGFEARNTTIDLATGGIADVRVARALPGATDDGEWVMADDEFTFHFVLEGHTTLRLADRDIDLVRGDSVSVPRGLAHTFTPNDGLELLDVRLP